MKAFCFQRLVFLSALVSAVQKCIRPTPVKGRPVMLIRLLAVVSSVLTLHAATINEDFSTVPTTRGWEVHNDSSLFVWNSTNQNLEVTWDSSKTNSYFRLPITPISSEQDFGVQLDLHMRDM